MSLLITHVNFHGLLYNNSLPPFTNGYI